MLMFAVLARGRLFRLLLSAFLFCFATVHGGAASAASLNVKVRQVNPDSAIQQVTCTDKEFKCLLPLDIQTGATKETLTVHVLFVPGNALFEFESPKGYLYAGDRPQADKDYPVYETIWHKAPVRNKPSTHDVTLFLPLVPRAGGVPILTAAQQPVADLAITMEEAP